jgi:riboflavin biosynthesis pyrimidine reductase
MTVLGPLDLLFEAAEVAGAGEPAAPLPAALAALYPGRLVLPRSCLYANVVASLDGVVAGKGIAPAAIALASPADRFVMGLLRAAADAVLIGAETLRAEPAHRWDAASIFPDAAAGFAALRRALGAPVRPALVVVTASGRLGAGLAALQAGDLILTTAAGAEELGRNAGPARVVVPGEPAPRLRAADIVAFLASRGMTRVLTEAGPALLGDLLAGGVVDELFVTLSPVLLGGVPGRAGLAGTAVLWEGGLAPRALMALRRHGSHLFLHYRPVPGPRSGSLPEG